MLESRKNNILYLTVVFPSETAGESWLGSLVLAPSQPVSTWTVGLTFSSPLTGLAASSAVVAGAGTEWSLSNTDWDGGITPDQPFTLRFLARLHAISAI